MNCVEYVCGVDGNRLPKPGDPNLNSITLTATPGFGGVNVNWSYPTLNAHAVSFTRVYRSTTSNYGSSIEIAKAAGSRYFDPVELTDTSTYYYWIRLVSVNGTEGELIGPALCTMESSIGKIIDNLSQEINEGLLAQALRAKIDRIQLLGEGITNLSKATEADILAMSKVVETLQDSVDNANAMITTERLTRISTIDALARELTTLEASFNNSKAILQQEIGVLTSDTESLARAVTVAQVTADQGLAAFREEQLARVTADNNLVSSIASSISQVESELSGNLAQAKTNLETNISTVNGKVTAIGARYTAQVSVNGLIGGFGIYNNGTSIEAGFDVDKFWIGNSSSKRKPFIVKNGTVYINDAVIETAKIHNFTTEVGTIANAYIGNAKIGIAQITNFNTEVGTIANAAIGNAVIGNAQIANASITTLKIAGQNVTSGSLAANAAGSMASGTYPFTITAGEKGAYVTIIFRPLDVGMVSLTKTLKFGNSEATAVRTAFATGNTGGDEGMTTYDWISVPNMIREPVGPGTHWVNVPSQCFAIAIVVNV